MDKQKLLSILENKENKSNADLLKALELLHEEFVETKQAIIDLTLHLDKVEDYFYKVQDELKKRNVSV